LRLGSVIARVIVLVAVLCSAIASPAVAQRARISLIRDAEIENTIRAYAMPLFAAADLDPNAVRVHLIKDTSLNAFVAGGPHIFFSTGLLARSESPGQVIGVIAHEVGHIAGGHLVRLREQLEDASTIAILSAVLGAAAAVVTREGGAAAAIALGGVDAATRNLLQYTRTQESAADQFAVTALDRTGQSAHGLLDLLEIMSDQEALNAARQDPYLRTHPLTRDRINFIQQHVQRSSFSNATVPADLIERHNRMRAKLDGFLESPARTLQRYKETDTSFAARYARAIAFYRIPDLGRALPAIDELIVDEPQNPYLHELKGQMLFENGRARDAVPALREANRLAPDAATIAVALAQAVIELDDTAAFPEMVTLLTRAVRGEPDNAFGWRLLGITYGRSGNIGMASLALAESAHLSGDRAAAIAQATRAIELLPAGSPGSLRAEDIRRLAERERARERERSR